MEKTMLNFKVHHWRTDLLESVAASDKWLSAATTWTKHRHETHMVVVVLGAAAPVRVRAPALCKTRAC